MARHHGFLDHDELLTARERAIADYGSAVACGGKTKRATKIRRYARSIGVSVIALDKTRSHAKRIGCTAASGIRRRVKARLG